MTETKTNMNTIPDKPHWHFHPNILAIVHPQNQCQDCCRFIQHAILALADPDNKSWAQAVTDQQNHIWKIAPTDSMESEWQCKFYEQKATLDNIDNKYNISSIAVI